MSLLASFRFSLDFNSSRLRSIAVLTSLSVAASAILLREATALVVAALMLTSFSRPCVLSDFTLLFPSQHFAHIKRRPPGFPGGRGTAKVPDSTYVVPSCPGSLPDTNWFQTKEWTEASSVSLGFRQSDSRDTVTGRLLGTTPLQKTPREISGCFLRVGYTNSTSAALQ